MIPYTADAIRMLSQKILTGVLPEIGSTYVMSDTAMLAMLLSALADEAESGISRRLKDVSEMTLIFAEAKAAGIEVSEAPAEFNLMSSDMTMSSVNQVHDRMTESLIRLHMQVETNPAQAELNEKIWRYLAASQERHALAI